MFSALNKSFGDLRDKKLRKALWAIALWSLGFFVVVMIALFGGLDAANFGAWAEGGAIVLGAFAFIGLFWFSFVIVAQTVAAFYLDGVVARVEEIDYPGLPPAKGTTVTEDVVSTFRFTGMLLLLNTVALPFYLIGLFVPFVSIGIFYLVNGYLFGREYAEVVILRRMEADEAAAWRKENRTKLLFAGAAIAFGMTIPLLNFMGPVIAAAFMTHIFHGTQARRDVVGSK
ncbi:MAG: EI24 domain-containing protein [Alphaproteobacteria bacterium]|jgi:CysZ protein|nr:hypothetical protein [Rhodospirillaceae bacterium]MDG2481799.1 EI24 domain-containing protein [Alphaproteobacteria bacterium]MBT6203345.1 hypothetical protein [Rhodospirillaceae bacterium]MBT6512579.1 hypothetical protein [Rhodospirillaceae bacterium]MBT7612758.1 hypothetical protein [Rhodospirillaceae bacterium]